MKILPKIDSRDLSFHKYGSVSFFPEEFNVDSIVINEIQPVGDVRCTAYMCCGIAEDKEKIQYDVIDLYDRIEGDQYGTDPRNTIKETIKGGILPEGGTMRLKPFSSYFSAHTGELDSFDNVRASLLLANYSIGVWGKWYYSWGVSTILQNEIDFTNYHAMKVTGWKQIYGEPMLVIDAFLGRPFYMKRSVFNTWANTYGFGSVVLSTKEISERRINTLMETVIDIMKNFVISLQGQLIIQKKKMI